MIASTSVYSAERRDHIPNRIDSREPEELSWLVALRAGFKPYAYVTEDNDARFVCVKLYPGLATELLP